MSSSEQALRNAEERTRSALEAGFRAILTLFAAVIGFGLKRLLDLGALLIEPQPHQFLVEHRDLLLLAQFRWPIFVVTTAAVARYFIGAAMHITFEHIRLATTTHAATFLRDVFWLGAYALAGMGAAYSSSPLAALWWLLLLHCLALRWAMFGPDFFKYRPAKNTWSFFARMNLLGIAGLLVSVLVMVRWPGIAYAKPPDWAPSWNLYWLAISAGAIVLLISDVAQQLKTIGVGLDNHK